MAQRPSVKQPKPLNQPQVAPERLDSAASSTQVLNNLQAEISTEAAPLWNFVLDNARVIATGVITLVLVITAVGAWQWRAETKDREARTELGRIVSRQDAATRLSELEAFAAKAPKSMILAVNMETAAAAVQLEQWDKAAQAYAAVAAQDKDSALAMAARLNRADVLLRQDKPSEALAELESLLPKYDGDMKTMLNQYIAEAAEAAGQAQRAITAYEAIIADLKEGSDTDAAFYRARINSLK